MTPPLDRRRYFSYGSNMIGSQMLGRAPDARLLGTARLDDYAFLISARGCASIRQSAGSAVYGLLWEITPACEASLDCHEGVGDGAYRKDTVAVATDDGRREALVYIAVDPAAGANRYGARWPQILAAARHHGFPAPYLSQLQAFG